MKKFGLFVCSLLLSGLAVAQDYEWDNVQTLNGIEVLSIQYAPGQPDKGINDNIGIIKIEQMSEGKKVAGFIGTRGGSAMTLNGRTQAAKANLDACIRSGEYDVSDIDNYGGNKQNFCMNNYCSDPSMNPGCSESTCQTLCGYVYP